MDWRAFVRSRWERSATRWSMPEPLLPAERMFHLLAEASEPFRHGLRVHATTDVRLFIDAAQSSADKLLLPGPEDRSLDGYARRVQAHLGRRRFQLFVDQPLVLDYGLWASVRRALSGLFEVLGPPVEPLRCEASLGTYAHSPRGLARREHHAAFTFVLSGELRVRLWKRLWGSPSNELTDFDAHARTAQTVSARAGDALYWPPGLWHLDGCVGPTLFLRVWVPVRGLEPTEGVREVVERLLARSLEHDPESLEPYLPSTSGPPAAGLVRAGQALAHVARTSLAHSLKVTWAKRVSASGLEPVPAPLAPVRLPASAWVQLDRESPIVRLKERGSTALWAVNGYALAVDEDAGVLRALKALQSGRPQRVAELCPREDLRELLDTLHRLRALQVAVA